VLRILNRPGRVAGLAAVALGGCLALTACGPVQLGAVAIVGGQRITSSTLATQVSGLNRYYSAHKSSVQLAYPSSETAQQVLAWMIRFRVRDKLAQNEGIKVTPGDVQRAIAEIDAQEKESGQSANLTSLAVANGLASAGTRPSRSRSSTGWAVLTRPPPRSSRS